MLAAHGGLARWRHFSSIEATIISGGKLWQIKGQPQDPAPRRMTVALHREWASLRPFGAADQKTDFTPERIAIEKLDGRVVAERVTPRESFADNGESWFGLQAHFPDRFTSHSRLQEFYFDSDLLLRRHHYRVDVAGGFAAIQYVYDMVEAQRKLVTTETVARKQMMHASKNLERTRRRGTDGRGDRRVGRRTPFSWLEWRVVT